MMVWPSLLAASLTRMADATLRNSIHRSGLEIIYMAVPGDVMKTVKSFLDVVIERIGDASAGFIILLFSLSTVKQYITYVHFVCVALILVWSCSFSPYESALQKPRLRDWRRMNSLRERTDRRRSNNSCERLT